MLLSKKKLQFINNMFTIPYRPNLPNYQEENLTKSKFNDKFSIKHHNSSFQKNNSFNNKSELTKSYKSSFPSYEFNSEIISNINYSIDDLNFTLNHPLRNEIIIENPEEVIHSGCLQGSVKQKLTTSQLENNNNDNDNNMYNNNISHNINVYNCLNNNFDENFANASNKPIIMANAQNYNSMNSAQNKNDKINVSTVIPGELAETVKLEPNKTITPIEEEENNKEEEIKSKKEENNEPPPEETPNIQDKKYKITSTNDSVVVLPPNYSTNDEEEFNAIKTLNQELSSWKKYIDKDGLLLYFKPLPVKDEKGKDVKSVISFLDTKLDFPASLVISKLNDFEFRAKFDGIYKKGKLINEKMIEGNIKVIDLYLYMKMPFIFSDRDFVVQKKCWLDYNGNKDYALFYMHSIENPDYPAKEKPVRGTFINKSGYVKPLGDNQCKLTMVTAMDIKMSLGVSAMSKSGADIQEKWVKNLKKELSK